MSATRKVGKRRHMKEIKVCTQLQKSGAEYRARVEHITHTFVSFPLSAYFGSSVFLTLLSLRTYIQTQHSVSLKVRRLVAIKYTCFVCCELDNYHQTHSCRRFVSFSIKTTLRDQSVTLNITWSKCVHSIACERSKSKREFH